VSSWFSIGGAPPNPTARSKKSGRQDLNLRPPAPESSPAASDGLGPAGLASQPSAIPQGEVSSNLDGVSGIGPDVRKFGAPVVRNFGPLPDGSSQGVGGPFRRRRDLGELLTVREVAARLKVSRATVYRLVDEELLERIWIDGSIRIPEASVARFTGG
jgi:excisionase family DNA binding protein